MRAPSIQIFLDEEEQAHIAGVGIYTRCLDLDPRAIESCLAEGAGASHRMMRGKSLVHVNSLYDYRAGDDNDDKISISVTFEDRTNRSAPIQRILKDGLEFEPQALNLAARTYRRFDYAVRLWNMVAMGGWEEEDTLITNMLEVFDETERELNKLAGLREAAAKKEHGADNRLKASAEERQTAKNEDERKLAEKRAESQKRSGEQTQTEEAPVPQPNMSQYPPTAMQKRLMATQTIEVLPTDEVESMDEAFPTESEVAPLEEPLTELEEMGPEITDDLEAQAAEMAAFVPQE